MTEGEKGTVSSRQAEMFESAFLPRHYAWRSLIVSVGLHCALAPALPWLGTLLPDTGDSQRRRYAVEIRPIEIEVSDLLYAPAPARPAAPQARSRPKRQERAPQPRKESARRFELPPLARRAASEQTVLQPQFPPDLALQQEVRLPNVVFWSTARLPKPEPKQFVRPGSPIPEARKTALLEAPPTLSLPNRELTVSDLTLSGGVLLPRPALPRPPATTVPVRVFQPPAARASGGLALDAVGGEPTNVIALSANPAPIGRSIIVPAGNQIGQLPGPPGDTQGTGTGDVSGAGGGGGAAAGGTGSGPGGSGAGSASAGTGSGGGTGSDTGSGLGSGAGVGAGNTSDQQGGAILAKGNILEGLAGVPAKVLHPTTAVFDIVVHSASAGALPDTTGILAGKPVYTVYLRVGSERDWVLQYCRPPEAERPFQSSDNIVTLGNTAPVKAPYPLVTVMPPVAQEPRRDPVLVHGFLDTTGKFKALKIVRDQSEEFRRRLLPVLQQWEFRPGTRDGLPVLLEILLVIPPNRA